MPRRLFITNQEFQDDSELWLKDGGELINSSMRGAPRDHSLSCSRRLLLIRVVILGNLRLWTLSSLVALYKVGAWGISVA